MERVLNLDELIQLRHTLHENAELSDYESRTADLIAAFLRERQPTKIIRGLGGHGLAAVFDSGNPGPRILVRCELDALPIPDSIELPYRSKQDGVSHKCGHDGHMAIVSGLADELKHGKIEKGTLILLYQPAEETGQGAARVLADDKFSDLKPDFVFALHNLPGFPEGSIIVKDNIFASASKGFIIELTGATSHAAQPDRGRSPAVAVSQIISALSAIPQFYTALHEAAQVTIVHSRVGERAFGTSPGIGHVMATLRAHDQNVMDRIADKCTEIAVSIAKTFELEYRTEFVEEFVTTVNDVMCVDKIRNAALACDLEIVERDIPFSWSEDFGHFAHSFKGALFGIGSGTDMKALHNPDYDFPDQIIEPAVRILRQVIDEMMTR